MIKKIIIYVSIFFVISAYPIVIAQTPSPDTSNAPQTTAKPYDRDDVYKQIELFSTALSYDDCEEIRELYSWCPFINQIVSNYSIAGARKKSELLLSNTC